MPKVRLTKTLMVNRETSFLTMLASSDSRHWEGVFGFHAGLNVVDFDLAPVGEWSVENFVLQISRKPVSLTHIGSERSRTDLSVSGTLIFLPRKEPLKVVWTDAAENLAFGVTPTLLNQVAADTKRGDPERIRLDGFGSFDDPLVSQIGWKLLELLHSDEPAARLYAEALGVTLAHHLLYRYDGNKAYRPIAVPETMHARQLRNALEYIHANYERDLSLVEIAASAYLSVAHFSRLFRKATGYSPYQYLIRCRVEQAYLLLKQRKYTTSQIAQMVGFYDESHLLRHFKRIYGTSPSKILL